MTYTRELVEHLLPSVWDEGSVYGIPTPHAPPQDMPRGTPNKAHGSTLYAHLADIHSGWKAPALSLKERQALILNIGMDLSMTEAAHVLDRPRKTVEYHVYTGVGKIVAELNGEDFAEGEE